MQNNIEINQLTPEQIVLLGGVLPLELAEPASTATMSPRNPESMIPGSEKPIEPSTTDPNTTEMTHDGEETSSLTDEDLDAEIEELQIEL